MLARISLAASFILALSASSPAQEQPAPAGAPAQNVVIVTLDGFRPEEVFGGADEMLLNRESGGVRDVDDIRSRYVLSTPEARREVLLPFLWGTIAKQGQIFGDRTRNAPATLTNGRKFSYPGYNELFCGFGDPRIDSNDKKPNPNLSVFEFLNAKPAYQGRVAAFCTWDVFPSIFRSEQNGLKVQAAWMPIVDEPLTDRQRATNLMIERLPRYWSGNIYDAVMMEAAREHLIRHKPRVLYMSLGETDEWAHERRYDLYLDAAHRVDRFLADLWKLLQEMPEYQGKTTLLISTDHGRGVTGNDWTSHGARIEGAEFIWIAALGAGVPSLGVRQDLAVTQSQVAATIATLLGENFQTASPKAAPPLPGISGAVLVAAP